MKRIVTLLAALAFCLLALGGQAVAQEQSSGDTLKVDDDQQQCEGAEFTSINEAIAAASPGDNIQVCPGLYQENVVVDKTLKVVGSGPDNPRKRTGNPDKEAVIDPPSPAGDLSPAVNLTADDIEFSLFTVQGPGSQAVASTAGISTSNGASGYRIENNLVTQNAIGLYLQSEGTNPTVVRQNAFVNNNSPGSASGTGIYSDAGLKNARIGNNYFTLHETAAINLAGAPGTQDNVQIDSNFLNDDSTIVLFNTTNTTVKENESVSPTGSGIFEGGGSTALTIYNNTLRDGPFSGIALSDGSTSEVLIEENTLKNFARGISLASGNTNKTVQENTVSGSQTDGIRLLSGATANTVSGNTLKKNGQDGIRLNAATTNTLEGNTSTGNTRDGIRLENASSGNTLTSNVMKKNDEHDAHDDNRAANTWIKNKCKTDFPPGTICGVDDSQNG